MKPKEVEVNINELPKETNEPIVEPPIIKETANVLGSNEVHLEKTDSVSEPSVDLGQNNLEENVVPDKEPVQELPVVKKIAHVLGEEVDTLPSANAIKDAAEEKNDQAADKTSNTLESTTKDAETNKPKKKKKRSQPEPPSQEEILKHHNTLDRAEKLITAIRELSPRHPILEELQPHIDGARRDLQQMKMQGIENTIKHVLIILEDVYVRLMDAKVMCHY